MIFLLPVFFPWMDGGWIQGAVTTAQQWSSMKEEFPRYETPKYKLNFNSYSYTIIFTNIVDIDLVHNHQIIKYSHFMDIHVIDPETKKVLALLGSQLPSTIASRRTTMPATQQVQLHCDVALQLHLWR